MKIKDRIYKKQNSIVCQYIFVVQTFKNDPYF